MGGPWYPKVFREPPLLDPDRETPAPATRLALLINPFYPKDPRASFGKHVLTPSAALTSIAAATPDEWTVACWDENLLQGPPPADPFPRVVGITVHLTFSHRAYEIADWYRARGATVILGGLHVQSCPGEAAPHADALAVGEGVQVWPVILRDIDAGRLKARYHGSYSEPYENLPAPRRSILPQRAFLTTAGVIATRGCHNRCRFCYLSTSGLRMPCQARRTEQVAEELRELGQPYAVFIDNNLGSDRRYLRELCRALRPLDIIWSAAVSLDVTADSGLVREMALSGCTGVFVGFESLGSENLTRSRKSSPRAEEFASRVDVLHDNGIQVNGSFVLGFDHDGPAVFDDTVAWIEDQRLECATFHILTPYPGTPLFRELEAAGRLLHRNWSLYDTSHAVFRPRNMSPEALEEGYARCYERLFSHRSIWHRRPSDLRALPSYLAMSYLYKKSNPLWHLLIRHNLTATVWRPLVDLSRRRHLRFRRRLAGGKIREMAGSPVGAGV